MSTGTVERDPIEIELPKNPQCYVCLEQSCITAVLPLMPPPHFTKSRAIVCRNCLKKAMDLVDDFIVRGERTS